MKADDAPAGIGQTMVAFLVTLLIVLVLLLIAHCHTARRQRTDGRTTGTLMVVPIKTTRPMNGA